MHAHVAVYLQLMMLLLMLKWKSLTDFVQGQVQLLQQRQVIRPRSETLSVICDIRSVGSDS
jgi:hypothetical protein